MSQMRTPKVPKLTNKHYIQGLHNLTAANHVIHDPLLTDLGNEQCRQLREKFPYHSGVELVVSSPLRRTIYTALQSFGPIFDERKDLKLVLLPDIQETSDVPCDTGSDPEVLRKEIEEKGLPVDLSLIHDGWNSKVSYFFVGINGVCAVCEDIIRRFDLERAP